MENALTDPTFLLVLGVVSALIPVIMGLIFKDKPVPKGIKRWVPVIVTGSFWVLGFIIWGAFKDWSTPTEWLLGITAGLGEMLIVYNVVWVPIKKKLGW